MILFKNIYDSSQEYLFTLLVLVLATVDTPLILPGSMMNFLWLIVLARNIHSTLPGERAEYTQPLEDLFPKYLLYQDTCEDFEFSKGDGELAVHDYSAPSGAPKSLPGGDLTPGIPETIFSLITPHSAPSGAPKFLLVGDLTPVIPETSFSQSSPHSNGNGHCKPRL
jgi:hypothetical protein